MIEKARARGIYDDLSVGDLIETLNNSPEMYDAVVACDVLVYMGDLTPAITATAGALRPGGVFLLTLEAEEKTLEYALQPSRRYAHSLAYVQRLAIASGLLQLSAARRPLRSEHGAELMGWVLAFGKPA
jgi:predicted TPR repeat methyltransferase